MPIHFEDRDVTAEVEGLSSALIVTCNMCPAITVAIREAKPFLNLLRSPWKSVPFEEYLEDLQHQLAERGVTADIFRSTPYHQWFMCMWTASKREELRERARGYDAVIVLGCASATETVRREVEQSGCRVIERMEVTGIMNAELEIALPGRVSFRNCSVVSM